MNLYFDLGTEIKSTTTEAIFLSPTTFRKLRIEPNFRLLFCNIISNYNSNQISIQNDLVFQYGFVEKFNFYSLIEDNFAKIRKIPYLPLRSLKLAENGIENYIYKKNSVKIAYPELEPIKESLTSLSCLGYRFEIRVKGLFIGSGINFLHSLFNPSSFVSIFYSTFLFIVNANLNIFNHSIKGNKLKDFQRNIIIETIFKEFFIKGSYNNHFLPSTLNLKKFLSNDFSLISKEVFEISKEEECFASRKLIKLLKEKDEYNKLGHILDNFNTIDNFTTKDIFSAINVCYLQYINDYKKKYKIDDIILNYKNLGRNIIYLKKDNSSLSLNYFINKTLFSSKTQKENMPYWYLLIFAKKKFDVTTEIFNDHICTYIIKHGLNIGFLHKNKSNEDHEYF
ncbi:hypothetical protein NBO_546g0001 [Nosema bombycis CQ1]|uniref:Uncharacterized protein n=1 Tax=Nosema bombycis (strain CQ1 / CVCC 102059) TaxID=578461 RepID=R0KPJ9_NOSB1|nr:hypothetical protein NBO_546g0001 [Nosema bombycis CQ1]|eukprot:EOB12112.1 hypothetical protein NBO_546g0001 [Nosema bombycis CQ1]